jgi:hypothetical protein
MSIGAAVCGQLLITAAAALTFVALARDLVTALCTRRRQLVFLRATCRPLTVLARVVLRIDEELVPSNSVH